MIPSLEAMQFVEGILVIQKVRCKYLIIYDLRHPLI
jgi:hypothetical protein